jgi:hypothetical protein
MPWGVSYWTEQPKEKSCLHCVQLLYSLLENQAFRFCCLYAVCMQKFTQPLRKNCIYAQCVSYAKGWCRLYSQPPWKKLH